MSKTVLVEKFYLALAWAIVATVAFAGSGMYIYQNNNNNPSEQHEKLRVTQDENESLKGEISEANTKIATLKSDIQVKEEEIHKLNASIEAKEKEIEQLKLVKSDADIVINKLNAQLNELKEGLKSSQARVIELVNIVEKLQKEIEQQKLELKSKEELITEINSIENLNNEIKNKDNEIQQLKNQINNAITDPMQAKLLDDISKRRGLLQQCKDAYFLYIIRLTQKVAIERFPEDYNNGYADKYKKKNGLPLYDTLDGPEMFPKLSSGNRKYDLESLKKEKEYLDQDIENCVKSYKKYVDWMFWYTTEKPSKGPAALGCKTPEDFEKMYEDMKKASSICD